jgi:hypothetical protein
MSHLIKQLWQKKVNLPRSGLLEQRVAAELLIESSVEGVWFEDRSGVCWTRCFTSVLLSSRLCTILPSPGCLGKHDQLE